MNTSFQISLTETALQQLHCVLYVLQSHNIDLLIFILQFEPITE